MTDNRARHARAIAAVVCIALVLVSCGGTTPDTNGQAPPLPTPMASHSAAVDGTVALVTQALAAVGRQVFPATAPYRPSEPSSLTQVPREVLQISSPDAGQGFVVIYELPTTAAATAAGQELASYLGSGFGQTNFPVDAQFSVAQVGSTIVFTWYSGATSSDATAAQAAFEAVHAVGSPFRIVK